MLAKRSFLLALLFGCRAALGQDRWLQFDVSEGKVSELIHSEFEPNTGLECRLRVMDWRYKDEWGPSFSIVLAEAGDLRRDAKNERFVGLSMTVGEDDNSRVYDVRVRGQEEPKLDTVATVGFLGDPAELVLRLAWRDDGTFSYVVLEQGKGLGEGQVAEPRVKPRVVIVTASGMSGMFSCKRYRA
jgi:hypothetical protein